MKKILLIVILLISIEAISQKQINYNFSLNATLMLNEDFGEYEDENLLVPNAFMFRNGFDIKLNKHFSTGVNVGFDWHPELDLLAIPYFIDGKFNIAQQDDDRFFIGAGIGKLIKIGKAFERGNYYKVGLGYEISSNDNFGIGLNVDFHQKKIADFDNGRLNSLSFGIGLFFL
ncbi:hypothetical protein R3X25_06160 [Lutibacter sp. TH_r2]|uniref:hypothetical protein n=1 Tax=Lutibacter sp. TH_r2 TaxID=3082083 RepID=UPI002955B190|nr:hypothetical protein [Lutibacter sp. TH_r2]MDV7186861.1 hypothetical protein [Lutibacter sp. TH_r2]